MQLEHTFTVPAGIDQAWAVLLDIERIAPCMPGAILDSVDGDDFTGTVKVRLGPIGLTYKGKASFVEKDKAAHRAVIDAQGKDARGNGTAGAKITATLSSGSAGASSQTEVHVLTDLNITGKPAQFGRGVMVDVGNKLIGQFADCLAGKLSGPDAAESDEQAVADSAEAAPGESNFTTDSADAAQATAAAEVAPTGAPETSNAVAPEPVTLPAAASSSEPTAPATRSASPGAHARPVTRPEVEPIDLMASAGPALLKRLAPIAVGAAVLAVVAVLLGRRRS